MMIKPLRVLFVGGTGTISASCAMSALAQGMDLTVFNRAQSELRPLPVEVTRLTGDVREPTSLAAAIGERDFDVVVNFLCYSADDARSAVETFQGRTGHYLHISTAMLYQKPPRGMPYRE
jgi:nucleoside-diphosphate-sugar epimerase